MVVVNDVLVYGFTPDKFLQILSADVQGGRHEILVQREVSVAKRNFRILDESRVEIRKGNFNLKSEPLQRCQTFHFCHP